MNKGQLKYHCRDGSGLIPVVSPKNARLRLIEFSIIRLSRGDDIVLPCAGKEVAVLLLSGHLFAEAQGEKFSLGPRKNVFVALPWTLYCRNAADMRLHARSRVEAVVSAVPVRRGSAASKSLLFRMIPPQEVIERAVGIDTYARTVRTAIGEDFPAHWLLLGETINEAGKWSSYPPHRHEKDAPPKEARLEEVYYYRTEKANGFGVQRIYTDDGRINETHTVRQDDVCVLPRGYHPVSAAPSSKLYYFWVLAGKNRKMQVRVDPKFA